MDGNDGNDIEQKKAVEQLWPMMLFSEVARRNELPGALRSSSKWSEELKKLLAPITDMSSFEKVNDELEELKEFVTIECEEGEFIVDRMFKEQCGLLDSGNDELKAYLYWDHRSCKSCTNDAWCAMKEVIGLIPSSA